MSDQIKAIKLVSGEELVAEIVDETEQTVTVKNPVATVLQQSRANDGALATGFMPWFHAAEGPYTILRDKIVCTANVAEEVKNGYNRVFGAGIVVPPQGLITG
jgi:hypothetical protein